jgi:hypothetical protein
MLGENELIILIRFHNKRIIIIKIIIKLIFKNKVINMDVIVMRKIIIIIVGI